MASIIMQPKLAQDRECRVKKYLLPIRSLIALSYPKQVGDYLTVEQTVIPDGAEVIGVEVLHCPIAVAVYLYHPSFAVVPFGQDPPLLQTKVHCYVVTDPNCKGD